MATTPIVAVVLISLIQAQRVTILKKNFAGNKLGWVEENLSGPYNGYISNNPTDCPNQRTCYVQHNQDHLYRYFNTTGYLDIEVSYQVKTTDMTTGDGFEFLWIKGTGGIGDAGWVHQTRHNCPTTCDILHTSMSIKRDIIAQRHAIYFTRRCP
eukprot:788915_1